MKWTNDAGLPGPLVEAIQADDYPWNPDPKHFSVTELIQPVRITLLHQRHRDEITQDASDALWSFLGRVAHKTLEGQRNAGRIQEKRFEAYSGTGMPFPKPPTIPNSVNDGWPEGYWISGQMDLMEKKVGWIEAPGSDPMDNRFPDPSVVNISSYQLIDFKVTSTYSFLLGDKDEWTWQLNIYAWLARQRVAVEKASIWAILRDWSKYKAMREHDYPKAPFIEKPIELMHEDVVGTYIRTRLSLLNQYHKSDDDELPLCSERDRWTTPTVYAVMKDGRKSALRLFDNMAEAQDFSNSHGAKTWVEVREGTDKRCAEYCKVAPWCSYWKEKYGKES